MMLSIAADETFDIGVDTGSPVSEAYQSPFKFTGTIRSVVIDVGPTVLSRADQETLRKTELLAKLAKQ
jgi:hypothetical protein